jgi:hypothetical protein
VDPTSEWGDGQRRRQGPPSGRAPGRAEDGDFGGRGAKRGGERRGRVHHWADDDDDDDDFDLDADTPDAAGAEGEE